MIKNLSPGFLLMFSIFTATGQEDKPLIQLKLLNGVWNTAINGKTIYESWKTVNPKLMTGMSYSIRGADTIVFEQTKIVDENNQVAYLARARNQNQGREVSFKLISSANKTFIFENPEHDFPQRVIYQLVSADSLHAWIEGKYQGKGSREDYYYRRMK